LILLQSSNPRHELLKIARPSAVCELLPGGDEAPRIISAHGPYTRSFTCYGIFGFVDLLAGPYLLVVTARNRIGALPRSDAQVQQVTGVEIVPCGRRLDELPGGWQKDELVYVNMLKTVFDSAPLATGLYFCHGQDLSVSLQSQSRHGSFNPLWKLQSASPFYANYRLLQPMLTCSNALGTDAQKQTLAAFVCQCIQGFVEIREPVAVGGSTVTFALISRRDISRCGARYHCRGIDATGKVANFVETEQIIFTPTGAVASYIQVRGSIPLFWRQNVWIKYKPELQIGSKTPIDPETARAFQLHRNELQRRYQRVVAVNLVDLKGGEGRLAQAFSQLAALDSTGNFKYVEFDFHHHCRKMRYDRIQSILVEQIVKDMDAFGWFELAADGAVKREQKGVVRTNCMDCLDRTNVVQSVLAERALVGQLIGLGLLPEDSRSIRNEPALWAHFRSIWADNADAISTQYSGTGALKTDFTRTGQRSMQGTLQDGLNSALRYFYGNVTDANRQDALDLLFGGYTVLQAGSNRAPYESPFLRPEDPIRTQILVTIVLALGLLVFGLNHAGTFNGKALATAGIFLLLVSLSFIWGNGRRFARYPRLNPPPFAYCHRIKAAGSATPKTRFVQTEKEPLLKKLN
jgi:hypothetical protein